MLRKGDEAIIVWMDSQLNGTLAGRIYIEERLKMKSEPSLEFITFICDLYDDIYDDRLEDCRPPAAGDTSKDPGEDWKPGQVAEHKSLAVFQRELDALGIKLSSSKIRKILITGGCWTTERSREIAELFEYYTLPVDDGGKGLSSAIAIKKISDDLHVSIVTVSVNLPYQSVVYKLENRSSNARRCMRYKERKKKQMR